MTRVAVTTTRDSAPRVSAALAAKGLEPVELPCIRIEVSPEDRLQRLRSAAADADLILLTSRRPVAILWDGSMPATPVAAVGSATADAVRDAGGTVHFTGTGAATELLPFLMQQASERRVVFPHAGALDKSITEAIARVATDLVAEPAYAAVPIGPDPNPPTRAVLFGSPSAVEGWTMTRTLDGLVVGAIGTTTAAALEELGHPPAVMPARPGFEALVTALADHLSHPGGTE